MNNGKSFPSLGGMACSNLWYDQPHGSSKSKSIGIFETFIVLNLLDKNSIKNKNIMKSQIKNKKNISKKFVELLIPTL